MTHAIFAVKGFIYLGAGGGEQLGEVVVGAGVQGSGSRRFHDGVHISTAARGTRGQSKRIYKTSVGWGLYR